MIEKYNLALLKKFFVSHPLLPILLYYYNFTFQLEKELAVNKSSLSSTVRKLTSASDDRTSAAAVGYALGVALLSATFGGLFTPF